MECKLDHISRRVWIAAMAFLGLTVFLVMAAAFLPLNFADEFPQNLVSERVPVLNSPQKNSGDLQHMITRRVEELIRPLQGIAAVKDDGVAQRMAKRLKLQGVINMGGEYVAYIGVDKGQVVAVKAGGDILDFSVIKVDDKSVILSREGVEVALP